MKAVPPFGVIIPARYASTRLPGKVLLELAGKPLIEHVYSRALESGAAFIAVATDDVRVQEAVRRFGGDAILTSGAHQSGTERLAEVARTRNLPPETIIVNLQGDEPMVPGALLGRVATALQENAHAEIATLATGIHTAADVFDPNVVKVVLDQRGFARYFSRAPIPWVRGEFAVNGNASDALPAGIPFLRHLGIYAYRARTLDYLCQSPSCPLEEAEALEQLRALWLGLAIHVSVIEGDLGHGVDTEQDLERVRQRLLERSLPRREPPVSPSD